ncbi:nitroreductase [Paenibacillus sp. SC116]|uniref:nitroreductase family protein n=1 Tax=Paenibacillus sp. SC116 TaxID=2968986 RepID=UPI00215B3768|nr:nitroreductase [Paenibacillus sp. SC116]MCR8843978.1 nitroreductase [Paenibacillus sp. SC116]
MSIKETIRGRRSTHNFKHTPIKKEQVLGWLDDAVYAPNHGLRQPWRFIFIGEQGKEEYSDKLVESVIKLGKFKEGDEAQKQKYREYVKHIPAFLVVVMPEDPRPNIWEEDVMAVSALVQNLQLLAWEDGVGMLWHTGGYIHQPFYRKTLGIQPGEKIIGNLFIGYPDEVRPVRPRKEAAELLTEF